MGNVVRLVGIAVTEKEREREFRKGKRREEKQMGEKERDMC